MWWSFAFFLPFLYFCGSNLQDLADKTKYNQTYNIKSGANIKELHIIEGATFANCSIEDGAIIEKVFVGDVEMTLEEFKATLE